jgi:hypothetical protein
MGQARKDFAEKLSDKRKSKNEFIAKLGGNRQERITD